MRRVQEPGQDTHSQRLEVSASRDRNQKTAMKGNTRQHMHSADPKDASQALHIFCSRAPLSLSPSTSPFLCLPLGQRLPCRSTVERAIPPPVGALTRSSPKAQPGTVAAFSFAHLPLFVAVPLLAEGLIPNDVNCTLVKGRGG